MTAAPRAADRIAVAGLGTALAFGTLAQGAFFGPQAAMVSLLVAVAVLARAGTKWRPSRYGTASVAAATWVLFALWALATGALHGDAGAALPTAALACCLAAAVVAATGLPEQSRRVLHGVVLAVAVVVAVTGWVGVALHLAPLALLSSGLWRGASTLTYANATAAFLVVSLVLAVAAGPGRRLAANTLVAVLLLGLLVTMSRAGGLGLVVALGAYAALDPKRLRVHLRVLPAVAVAFAGLLPSLAEGSAPQPLLAVAGAAAGFAMLAVRVRGWHALVLMTTAAAALVLSAVPAAADRIAANRLTVTSDERGDLTRVTAEQFWSSPITGVGPGQVDLRYLDHAGVAVRAVFTHDEYLQTAAETGVVGLALVVAGAAALMVGALRRRDAAAVAVLAGFAVHSAFDFLWHIPVLPLLLILTAVPLITHPREDNP